MKKYKGSLSLEAVISFTIFISFMFLLLSIVKFSLVRITLNTATAETAKQIATASYPLSYLLEIENSENAKIDAYEGEMALTEGLSNNALGASISSLFNTNQQETTNVVNTITKMKDLLSGGDNAIVAGESLVRNLVAELETEVGAYVACNVLNNYIEKSVLPFNKEDITLSIVKFPQSEYAYSQVGTSEGYPNLGLTKDMYSAEDVVIAVEYKYDFALPFLPSFKITMREVAVEHGWLYGGGNNITNREDGIDYSKFKSIVFGENPVYLGSKLTGSKYHKKDCRTLWHGSIIMNRDEANNQGYSPCKVCKP